MHNVCMPSLQKCYSLYKQRSCMHMKRYVQRVLHKSSYNGISIVQELQFLKDNRVYLLGYDMFCEANLWLVEREPRLT